MCRILIACVLFCATGCMDKGTNAGGSATTAAKLPTREEFKAKVMGKTADEVIAAIGRPDSTDERLGSSMWSYRDLCYDPISGKTDRDISIHFGADGRVVRVNF